VIPVESITLSSAGGTTTITADNGTLQLSATILPADATNKSVNWSVENLTGMASISASGLLTAQKNGTVKVVATANDGSGVKGELQITISNQKILIENISIIDNLLNDTIKGIGTKITLKAAINPSDATNQTIQWSVENLTGKATIDENGLLSTISQGTINVIAKANDESQCTFQKKYVIVIPVSTSVKDLPQVIGFNLFPNPTNDKIHLQIDQITSNGVTVEIINTQGLLLAKKRIFEPLTEWPISQFPGNIFFVTVIDQTSSSTKKIIVSPKQK
jgi:uncharacterized protein YjdB